MQLDFLFLPLDCNGDDFNLNMNEKLIENSERVRHGAI